MKELEIGVQTWMIKDELNADFESTLAKLKKQGFESIEMCSPYGYREIGFGPLEKRSTKDLKMAIRDAGLSCESCHFTFKELEEDLEKSIDFAKSLDLDQMVFASLGIPKEGGLDEWKKRTDKANKIASTVTDHGLDMVYHNHNLEFEERDGEQIYGMLLDRLDSATIKMQFQVWVVSIGYHAAKYFRAHPGRFISAHLADWTGIDKEYAPIGAGKVDWTDFFEAGEVGGLKNMYIEMAPSHFDESISYLRNERSQ